MTSLATRMTIAHCRRCGRLLGAADELVQHTCPHPTCLALNTARNNPTLAAAAGLDAPQPPAAEAAPVTVIPQGDGRWVEWSAEAGYALCTLAPRQGRTVVLRTALPAVTEPAPRRERTA